MSIRYKGKMENFMQITTSLACACALFGLTGCASAPHLAVLAPIGPAPRENANVSVRPDGLLEVYSARERAITDVNAEEFFWNNDFGKNSFLFRPAHTGYDIYGQNGTLVKHVPNARDDNDAQPTVVALPPGAYEVRAQAEAYGAVTYTAMIPVVIKPGFVTVAHLEHQWWTPSEPYAASDMVWLPNGYMAGWQAGSIGVAGQPTGR